MSDEEQIKEKLAVDMLGWMHGMIASYNARNGYSPEDIERLTAEREARDAAYRARQKCRNCTSWELRDRSDKHSVKGRCHRLSQDLRPGLYWKEEFGPDDCCGWVSLYLTEYEAELRERYIRRIEHAASRPKAPVQGSLF